MTDERKLLHEAKTEWKLLVLETRLRAYREEYGEEELNEIMGALKKAGTLAQIVTGKQFSFIGHL